MKRTNQLSVLVWADRRKTDAKGRVPLYARITYRGKRAEISMGRKVNPNDWDPIAGYLKGSGKEVKDINKEIAAVDNDVRTIYFDLKHTDEGVTLERIKEKYLGKDEEPRKLLKIFDEHNKNLEGLVGKDFVKATLTKYNTVRDKTASYIQSKYKKDDLYLSSVDYAFVVGFELFLKTHEKIEHNTAMRYIKNLKKIVNLAFNHGWIKTNPFNLFKCTYKKVHRTVLEWEEINQLAAKEYKIARLSEVRDVFLFCCYTGYAFVDVEKLTTDNLVTGTDNVTWIKTDRTKSHIESNVPLIPRALEILDKYKEHDCRIVLNKLLPVKSNQKMNAYLKEVGDLALLETVLTTHIARHTFATTVTLNNDVPMESVSKMMGHTKLSTTQIYAKTKDPKVNRDMSTLKAKLEEQEVIEDAELIEEVVS